MILLVLRRLNEQFYCTETKNRFGLKLREKKRLFVFDLGRFLLVGNGAVLFGLGQQKKLRPGLFFFS